MPVVTELIPLRRRDIPGIVQERYRFSRRHSARKLPLLICPAKQPLPMPGLHPGMGNGEVYTQFHFRFELLRVSALGITLTIMLIRPACYHKIVFPPILIPPGPDRFRPVHLSKFNSYEKKIYL